METTLEIWRLGSGDDVVDLVSVEWRRRWRLSDWGVETGMETMLETWRLESGEDTGDLAAGG